MTIDFTALTLGQIVILLFGVTALDWMSGVGGALAHGTFSLAELAQFVGTHVLGRVIPLSFAAAIGQGLPQLGLAPVPAVWGLFLAAGAAYLAETLASIASNLRTPSPTA